MFIKSELIWGESISNKTELYDLLQAGKLPFGFYLLVCTEQGKLEMMPASMQNNRFISSKDSVIFGVAKNKNEAKKMICDIITQVYTEHVYSSVEAYVKEILGDKTC